MIPIEPIRTEAELRTAIARLDALWAEPATPERGRAIEDLVLAIVAYKGGDITPDTEEQKR